jgi:AcrR family transcriptional regulator
MSFSDARNLSATQLEGVAPLLQARSQATFNALIDAGLKILEAEDFDAATVNQIARAANVSVGAFYGRFANKDVFFSAMQEITVSHIEADLHSLLDSSEMKQSADAVFLSRLAGFWIGFYKAHRGLYLAAFQHARYRPGTWTPFKRLGWNIAGLVANDLMPRLEACRKGRSEREIRIAFQFVNGMLVNAILNAPGPISLDDEEMHVHIASFLCSYFDLGAAEAVRRGGAARSRKKTIRQKPSA